MGFDRWCRERKNVCENLRDSARPEAGIIRPRNLDDVPGADSARNLPLAQSKVPGDRTPLPDNLSPLVCDRDHVTKRRHGNSREPRHALPDFSWHRVSHERLHRPGTTPSKFARFSIRNKARFSALPATLFFQAATFCNTATSLPFSLVKPAPFCVSQHLCNSATRPRCSDVGGGYNPQQRNRVRLQRPCHLPSGTGSRTRLRTRSPAGTDAVRKPKRLGICPEPSSCPPRGAVFENAPD